MKRKNIGQAKRDQQVVEGRNIPFIGLDWQREQIKHGKRYLSPNPNRAQRRAQENPRKDQESGVVVLDTGEIGKSRNGKLITKKLVGYRLRVQIVEGKKIVHYDRINPLCTVRFGKGEV